MKSEYSRHSCQFKNESECEEELEEKLIKFDDAIAEEFE